MADYRRWYVAGGSYFFTLVTYRRRPLFREASARELLGDVMREIRERRCFETVAVALLWDHLHCIW
ncbi:MAG: transposase, partial [Planctomycetes bacterium]|nr:transposase [Planctomycetota bacterium]